MTDKLATIRNAIQGEGPKNVNQARKLARMAIKAVRPNAVKLEEDLAEAFAAIPLAEQLRGESGVARHEAMKALNAFEREQKKR